MVQLKPGSGQRQTKRIAYVRCFQPTKGFREGKKREAVRCRWEEGLNPRQIVKEAAFTASIAAFGAKIDQNRRKRSGLVCLAAGVKFGPKK